MEYIVNNLQKMIAQRINYSKLVTKNFEKVIQRKLRNKDRKKNSQASMNF